MTIERINAPEPIPQYSKADKTSKSTNTQRSDSINVSDEAKSRAEVYNATEAAKNSPAIRRDKVEEIKKKLEDPSYINNAVVEMVADKIMNHFGI